MCVYCKGAPACDHERDACAASRGEVCTKCGHRSAAIVSYKPPPSGGLRPTWRVRRRSPAQVASGGAGMGPSSLPAASGSPQVPKVKAVR